ncbi:bud emergence protein 1 [Phlyctochytrium planicorne]|nr:bud emergence protein 1 [Phlyctochytrium planicorne]
MAYGGSGRGGYDQRDTLYSQYGPGVDGRSPSGNAPYSNEYDDRRYTRADDDYYEDDRPYLSPPSSYGKVRAPSPQSQRHPPSEYYDDPPPQQQYYHGGGGYNGQQQQQQPQQFQRSPGYDNTPPPTQYSQQNYQQRPPQSPSQNFPASPRSMGAPTGPNSPGSRRPPPGGGGGRNPPPGFKVENGVLIPVAPRGSSHPTQAFYQPPKKVIRAMQDYTKRAGNELSFVRGDFFYVVNENDRYYEVVNPLEKFRGQVPKEMFEGLEEMQARTLANARAAAGLNPDVGYGDHFFPGMDDIPTAPSPAPSAGNGPLRNNSVASAAQQQRGPPEIIKPNADGFYVPKHQQLTIPSATSPLPNSSRSGGPPPSPRGYGGGGGGTSPVSPTRSTASDATQPLTSPSFNRPPQNQQQPPQPVRMQTPQGSRQPSNAGFGGSMVVHAIIHDMELREDGKYWYAVEIEKGSGERSLLFRTFDDFWALQVALLNHFPAESGRRPGVPRIIPFLSTPPQGEKDKDLPPAAARQRKQLLVTYLAELLRLPAQLIESPQARRFFQPRQPVGDVFSLSELEDALPIVEGRKNNAASARNHNEKIKEVTDVGGTLFDLIENYNATPNNGGRPNVDAGPGPGGREYPEDEVDFEFDDQPISPASPIDTSLRIKVSLGDEMLAFRIPDDMISYRDLIYEVEDRMIAVNALPEDQVLNGLAYKDECNMLVPLCGDEDLRLLFRTLPSKLVFYPR